MARDIQKIILHHSAADAPTPQLQAINSWHKARGFPLSSLGFFVGYHYVIEKDGSTSQTRTDEEIGAHDEGENFNSIGICLVGDFNKGTPTKLQIISLGKLLFKLCKTYGLWSWQIEPHRINDTTDCYGKNLPDSFGREVYICERVGVLERISDGIWRVLNEE